MGCHHHHMAAAVDAAAERLGIAPPEKEQHALAPRIDPLDHLAGERLPAEMTVRIAAAALDREDAVQQQHAAPRPSGEIAIGGTGQAKISGIGIKDFQ